MSRGARCLRRLLPVAAVLSIAVLANLAAVRYPLRMDLTSSAIYSLGPQSVALLGRLREPVAIRYFYDTRSRAMQDARYLLQQYAAASPMITLNAHDPALEPAIAEQHGVRFAGTVLFTGGGRRIAVHSADETAITNALVQISSPQRGLICFTDGHVESNPFSLQAHDHFEHGGADHGHSHGSGGQPLTLHERHGMGMARNALETLGYTVQQRHLLQGPAMLEGCTVVVVASPQQPFRAAEVAQLRDYLGAGGAVLFLLEPAVESGLAALLNDIGLALSAARVYDPERHYWTDPATPAVSDYPRHRVTRHLALTFFPGAAAVQPAPQRPAAPWRVTSLVESSGAATTGPDGAPATATLVVSALDPASGARVIVSGDGDFATNSFFAALGNGQLFLNLVAELAQAGSAIDITPRDYVVAELNFDNRALGFTFLITTVAGPLLLLLLGAWVGWRRR